MERKLFWDEVIRPLKKTARLIDKKLPELQTNLDEGNRGDGKFPVESWTRLQEMNTHVTGLNDACSSDATVLSKNAELLSQYNDLTNRCLNMLGSELTSLKERLSKSGYVAKTRENNHSDEKQPKQASISLNDISNIPRPKAGITSHGGKLEKESNDKSLPSTMERNDSSPEEVKTDLHSPKMPVLTNPPKRSEILNTPTAPNMDVPRWTSQNSSNYFNKLSSPATPSVEVDNDSNTHTPDLKSTSRAFFPVLKTPKTPELSIAAVAPAPNEVKIRQTHAVKGDHEYCNSDDEQLVMHSRKSFLNNYHNEDPPDITLTQLKAKCPMPPQEMASPVTPDLQQYGVTAMKTSSYRPCFADSSDALQSPAMPSLVQDKAAPKRRSSFWVSNDEYEVLPIEMRRLFTIEQANGALYAMKMELNTSSKSGLTLEDIEKATSLGSKTRSFVLMLTMVGAVHKVPGTNRYHVNE